MKLKINDDVLDYIVDKAIEYKLGARGLRSIFETIMIEAMFTIPSSGKKQFTVTKKEAEKQWEKSKWELINSVN